MGDIGSEAGQLTAIEITVIILRVHRKDQTPLVEVGFTADSPSLMPDPLQSGHKDRQEKRDDGNDHEKLD